MSEYQSIGVLGAGAWGTALAQSVCLAGRDVTLWAHETETALSINQTGENTAFLKGVKLNQKLRATSEISDLAATEAILLVTPAQFTRSITAALASHLQPGTPVVICAKGIEQSTRKLMSEVISETLPQALPACLSGPSFAVDVARGLPTAVTLAASNETAGKALSRSLSHKTFRPYWSNDLIGVQLGGAVKNVLAIAAGIVVGKKLGASAHAGLITRGFAEMKRFAVCLGADPKTLGGLSGLGDLVLTCSSPQSRNMSLGIALGEGKTLDDILSSRRAVSEGIYTAKAVSDMANKGGIQMPIVDAVSNIIDQKVTIDAAIETLLTRPLKSEV